MRIWPLILLMSAACGEAVTPPLSYDAEVDPGEPLVEPPELELPDDRCDQAAPDPCDPSPCHPGVQCEVVEGWGIRCGSCPEGMVGDGFECAPPPRLEIHEFDYDQPGSDTAEFIEIVNVGEHPASLVGMRVELVNGGNSQVYRAVALDPIGTLEPGAFAVLAAPLVEVPEEVPVIRMPASAWLQNGPDAIVLLDAEGEALDLVVYGGTLEGYAPEWHVDVLDTGHAGSLSRIAPGGPFVLACEPTPGRANAGPCE